MPDAATWDIATMPARKRTPEQRADAMLDTITRLRHQLAEERRYTRQWVRRCADALREADQAHAHIQAVEDERDDERESHILWEQIATERAAKLAQARAELDARTARPGLFGTVVYAAAAGIVALAVARGAGIL